MTEECDKFSSIKLAKKILEKNSLISKNMDEKDIESLRRGLRIFYKDCKICNREGGNKSCFDAAEQKLKRSFPGIRDSIYPWKNYDWNYSNFVDNNYHPMTTGASPSGDIRSLIRNVKAMIKIADGYVSDANPNIYSEPGKITNDRPDIYGDLKAHDCKGLSMSSSGSINFDNARRKACIARTKVEYSNKQKMPYKDRFFYMPDGIGEMSGKNEKGRFWASGPTKGKRSSSYFIKIGNCPRPDIIKKINCIKRGYNWKNNECNQTRYAYINNEPGMNIASYDARGLIPSMTKDFLSLTPDKLYNLMQGKNIVGLDGTYDLILQKCPKINKKKIYENFLDKDNKYIKYINHNLYDVYLIIFIVISVIIIIFYVFKIFFLK